MKVFDKNISDITIKNNEEFVIELKSNPTTGYKWYPVFDNDYFAIESNINFKNENLKIGGGGLEKFIFKPLHSGETVINFFYKRPWDNNEKEKQQFHIKIK